MKKFHIRLQGMRRNDINVKLVNMNINLYCVLLAALICLTKSQQHLNLRSFSWSSCSKDDAIGIQHISVSPDPIVIPGPLQINTKFYMPFNLGAPNKYHAAFKVEKRMGTSWLTIPCLNGFGSCQFNDVCKVLDQFTPRGQTCMEALDRNAIPCRCPFNQGEYTLENGVIPINFNLPASVIDGDYHLNVVLKEENVPSNLLCFDVWFSLKARTNNARFI